MADSITGRTMFFDTRNGQVRFHDWYRVDTTLGTMMEPRSLVNYRNGTKDNKSAQINLSDQCAKITALEAVDLRGIDALLSDKKKMTVSGYQMPTNFSY